MADTLPTTTYPLNYTGKQVADYLAAAASINVTIDSINKILNTKATKNAAAKGKFAVFDENGDLIAGSITDFSNSFQWLTEDSISVPMQPNFTYDTTGISQIAAGIQANRIEANQLLTGQVIAGHGTNSDVYGTAPVADAIVFQKVDVTNSKATSSQPKYDTFATLSGDRMEFEKYSPLGAVPENHPNEGLKYEVTTNKMAHIKITFKNSYNRYSANNPIWGSPILDLYRIGNLVHAYMAWSGKCVVTGNGTACYYYEDVNNNSRPIPLGYRPVHGIQVPYIGVSTYTVNPNVVGYWVFSSLGQVGGLTNNGGGWDRWGAITWITTDAWPASNNTDV